MTTGLDTRTWLIWGFAAMLPLLVGRNPWITLQLLTIVLIVRTVAVPPNSSRNLGWFVRIAAFMAAISMIFNVLTVRSGDKVIATLPESWPVIGGSLTLNALVYGLVSGLTLFALVCTGLTVAALIRWIDLFHVLPSRLAPIAMTGSVAWAFLPQTALAWKNIRETMAMRGHQFRRPGDFLPIVVPLLASGLDRSLAMAEALESRGFGAPIAARTVPAPAWQQRMLPVLLSASLVGLFLTTYLLATGDVVRGILTLACSVAAFVASLRLSPPPAFQTTRYNTSTLAMADWTIVAAALLAIVGTLLILWRDPVAMTFTIYPTLAWPTPNLVLMGILAPLLLPAMLLKPKPDHQ